MQPTTSSNLSSWKATASQCSSSGYLTDQMSKAWNTNRNLRAIRNISQPFILLGNCFLHFFRSVSCCKLGNNQIFDGSYCVHFGFPTIDYSQPMIAKRVWDGRCLSVNMFQHWYLWIVHEHTWNNLQTLRGQLYLHAKYHFIIMHDCGNEEGRIDLLCLVYTMCFFWLNKKKQKSSRGGLCTNYAMLVQLSHRLPEHTAPPARTHQSALIAIGCEHWSAADLQMFFWFLWIYKSRTFSQLLSDRLP